MKCFEISPNSAPEADDHGCTGATVCHCHQVNDLEIREAIDAVNADSIEEISLQTRAGTGCRGCHCKLQRMLIGLTPHCGKFGGVCGACGCIAALCDCDAA